MVEIRKAQKMVAEYLEKIGYTKIETEPTHAFIHLVEEVGETARSLLYRETSRNTAINKTKPKELEEEVADIFWQTLKLASYLNIDLEDAFIKKFEKNKNKHCGRMAISEHIRRRNLPKRQLPNLPVHKGASVLIPVKKAKTN